MNKIVRFLRNLFFKKRVKILICGEARHGKDTVAELLNEYVGYRFVSSSEFVGKKLYETVFKEKYGYKSFEECFEDRQTKRQEWYLEICKYNTPDKARTTKEIIASNDIYVGMRDLEEFEASESMFDIKIWVDASGRLPKENSSSNKLNKSQFDIIIENNGTLDDLKQRVLNLSKLL